ncbi:2,4-diaminopentanoate dehydrogenase [soil metagenome]
MAVAGGASDDRIRVAIVGFGRVGRAVLELAQTRPWLEVVALFARRPQRSGEPASVTVPTAPADLAVRVDAEAALAGVRPDMVVVATRSRLTDVLPQLRAAADSGARAVVCTAEELAYVQPGDSPEAAAIHELAERHSVAVVASGVNPGFVLDLWPLALSALAWDVERLEARRIGDVSVFAPHTRTQLGIGHDEPSFRAGVAAGTIAGHLGFRESLRLLSAAMGRPAERITIDTEPVLAERDYVLSDGLIPAGRTVAASQKAVAWWQGDAWISVEMLLHVAPEQDAIRPIDEAHLYGRHELHATIDPGSAAVIGAAAHLVNIIPTALEAAPGLYRPGTLPLAAPWLAASRPMATTRTSPVRA